MNLLASIDQWGQRAPERPAHVSGGRTLTYSDLIRQSDCLAAQIASRFPGDKSPIAVIGHKEPEMLVAFLGVVKAGHPYVPIDTSIPAQRAERIVQTAKARLILTPADVAAWAQQPMPTVTPAPVAWNDPYYIIFTSGSTGEPKGVVITLECLTGFVEWMLAEQKLIERQEVFLNQAPFSFDLSVMDLYLSLATGGTLYSITAEQIANPKQLYQAFGSSGITAWVSTPSFAQMCLIEKTFNEAMLPGLRRLLFCGETLAPEVAAQLLERFPQARVWNTYGPTEATCCTTSIDVDRGILARCSPLPVGYVKPSTRILIMDEAGQPVAAGEHGEIVIAGPNVSPGYLGQPDQNARSFFLVDGQRAYRTGDRGYFDNDMLFFEGRMDNQIKLHGYRIELGDIEANLQALPGIRDAVVIPVLKQGKADSLAAFIILTEPHPISDFELGLHLKQLLGVRVPPYMVPRKFYRLEQFPMTPNGKADRRKLAESIQ